MRSFAVQYRSELEASYLVPFRSYCSLLFKLWTLCVFEPPFRGAGGGLGTTYDVHLGLIGKCVVNFLELFAADVTAEATGENRSKIGDFDPTRSV